MWCAAALHAKGLARASAAAAIPLQSAGETGSQLNRRGLVAQTLRPRPLKLASQSRLPRLRPWRQPPAQMQTRLLASCSKPRLHCPRSVPPSSELHSAIVAQANGTEQCKLELIVELSCRKLHLCRWTSLRWRQRLAMLLLKRRLMPHLPQSAPTRHNCQSTPFTIVSPDRASIQGFGFVLACFHSLSIHAEYVLMVHSAIAGASRQADKQVRHQLLQRPPSRRAQIHPATCQVLYCPMHTTPLVTHYDHVEGEHMNGQKVLMICGGCMEQMLRGRLRWR